LLTCSAAANWCMRAFAALQCRSDFEQRGRSNKLVRARCSTVVATSFTLELLRESESCDLRARGSDRARSASKLPALLNLSVSLHSTHSPAAPTCTGSVEDLNPAPVAAPCTLNALRCVLLNFS
jgi:hypothetical protein